ncbi:hypothetical protein BFC18_16645 [Alteromonas confluentis]|uniref:EamA domain-containing protein n=2 Tax=Alteromonas confluentis TaxID=1656094 RepID=A0A1E7Z8F4_9ALTE|nr:hypothetical protein BFC18_16645 [Alteromonas confluentis]
MALAVLSALGFSFKAIFVKQAYVVAPVEPVILLSLRMLYSLPFFLMISLPALQNIKTLSLRELFLLVCIGIAGYYGASILDFIGLQYISAGLERIILFSYPILTIILGVFFLGHRFDKRLLVPMGLCTFGVVCACISDIQVGNNESHIWLGIMLVTGSAICYAFYQAFSEPMIERLGAKAFSILAMLVSVIAVELHFFSQLPLSDLKQPPEIYVQCAMMAIFSTVLPVFFQSSAIKYIGAARAVLVSTIGPALTLVFGWLILGEAITLLQVSGMLLVLVGVLTIKSKRT